ncbi:kelch repeat-containing protein [Archangium primigenium]|uniref:kelch repeat-containing protein n=1 Tax=[Archangium] primigenium TaxID=2792470 RepID=UPI00195B336F|nr:kelch-like protein [Archangium primigenium]
MNTWALPAKQEETSKSSEPRCTYIGASIMTKAPAHLLLVLACVLSASCGSPDTGSAQFAVSVRQELATAISRVSITSSAADFPSITQDLALTAGSWSGTIGNIPAGYNRSFLAQAFDSSGTKLFEGSVSDITIYASKMTAVAIILQQFGPPPPFQNEAPVIDSLVASSTTTVAGGSISLVATAHDPNTGDTSSYAWTATAGTFSMPTALSSSWTAPKTTGLQRLTFTVTDSGGLSSKVTLVVNVTYADGEGEAKLDLSFNSSPSISAMSATPTQLPVGQRSIVSASVSDPDGDSLSYAWSASCAGSWDNASSPTAQFTPSELPAGTCNNCRLTVKISDGRGGSNSGTVALCVSNTSQINHLNPVIVRSYRSSDTATAAQVLTYEVDANDPEGSALTFSWTANTGTIGTPSNSSSSSRVTWTAPSCVSPSTSPTIVATVTNGFNLTATRSFSVTGLTSCSGWSSTGSMAEPRQWYTATRLSDGKVLVTGGTNSTTQQMATAEVYDPVSGTWSAAGSMAFSRLNQAAVLLPDGKVLVSGGNRFGNAIENVEVFVPVSGIWKSTQSTAARRRYHTATLLLNGKALIAGGDVGGTAEVYDPSSETWSTAGVMTERRWEHTATLLPGGKVLVTGGYNFSSSSMLVTAEEYDPSLGTWSATGAMTDPRRYFTATLLPNGKVLVVGGYNVNTALRTAEVYDPASRKWSATSSMAVTRAGHTATLLPNGKVLVAGGNYGNSVSAEIYDPATGTWIAAGTMSAVQRNGHTAELLLNGKVLVMGGSGATSRLATAELYTP